MAMMITMTQVPITLLLLLLGIFTDHSRAFAIRFGPSVVTPSNSATRKGPTKLDMTSNDDNDNKLYDPLPKSLKVYYWKFPFWRAEVLRAGLYLQDIPFEDVTDKERLDVMKQRCPFGAFPVLEINGKLLSQTQACATYVGKLGNMYPSNEDILDQANCDEIINGCTDITDTSNTRLQLSATTAARPNTR